LINYVKYQPQHPFPLFLSSVAFVLFKEIGLELDYTLAPVSPVLFELPGAFVD